MFLSQCMNAGMISILYPFAIFGYALMEEGRPGKTFWVYMTYYTLFILFMKFTVQLTIWEDLGMADTYSYICVNNKIFFIITFRIMHYLVYGMSMALQACLDIFFQKY